MAKKHTLKELKTLGHNLLTSRAHINNLPILIAVITPTSPPQHALEALLSLQSFFTPLLPQLPSSAKAVSNRGEDPETVFRVWYRAKFDELVKGLVDVVVSPQCDETLRDVVLDTIMDFVKVGNGGKFYSALYHRLLNNMVLSVSPVDFLFESLASKYFKYIDVRYFTYISLEKIVKTMETKESQDKKVGSTDNNNENQSETSMEQFIRKTHYIISHVPALESRDQTSDHEMWSDSGSVIIDDDQEKQSNHLKCRDKRPENEQQNCNELSPAKIVKKIKLKFSKAWISFLLLPLPLDVYKGVLSTLHQAVIPYMSNPPVLCDFLTRSYDIGGVISVMALSSLFILMTQYGLEYPNFYDKLYALLTPSIFMAKHRAKFFQLLDSCLKSPLLPAYLAASFAKKLSRLAISVPPSGGIIIIALIHNLLRRHPSINFLVHWEDLDAVDESNVKNSYADDVEVTKTDTNNCHKRLGADHFNSEENNPMKTNAMRSSLWEIDTLRHHYCPSVSRFVSSLEEDLTVRAKTTEIDIKDFSAASYATIFGDEIRRRVKQVPLAFYKATPTSLFSESDFAGWTFNYKDLMEKDDGLNENATEDTTSSKRQRIEWQ